MGKESNDLWWTWQPDAGDKGRFNAILSAAGHISEAELKKTAESMGK